MNSGTLAAAALLPLSLATFAPAGQATKGWHVGTPIVTYWAGPALTDQAAALMAEGGWNLVWCQEKELDVAARHGLRGQLQNGLLTPTALEDPAQKQQLDTLIERVKAHPALYSYFITDEPNATNFPGLGRLVGYLRDKDPAHLAYINLFPTYASNEQLGNSGEKVPAYQAHLRQYLDTVKPALLSYDHYQFTAQGDSPDYFLNLGLIRQSTLESGLPFLNIVQAATWTPSMRVPQPNEMRYLVYTTLAYGAQGISYYVYCCAGHSGGIANPDGSPTSLYGALQRLNRDFVLIARELQPLKSIGVYHAGMMPPGSVPLPTNAAFSLDPPVASVGYHPPQPLRGVLVGFFGEKASKTTHALVVNLDYNSDQMIGLRGSTRWESLDTGSHSWERAKNRQAEIRLGPGAGKLVRLR